MAHAGWRGLVAGVVEATVGGHARRSAPRRCRAALGPCIRARVLRVRRRPTSTGSPPGFGDGVRGTTAWGTPALDLPAGVGAACARPRRRRSIDDRAPAPRASPTHWFSHRARRRAGPPGRRRLAASRDRRRIDRRATWPRRPERSAPASTAPGGDPARSRLVAVTKGFGADAVAAAARRPGCADVGENYAQELVAKAAGLVGDGRDRALALHRAAPAQQGAPARAARRTCGRRVDRPDARPPRSPAARPAPRVLVQVNVSGEPQKGGCPPDDVRRAGRAGCADLGLDVRGLMAVGPAGPPEAARAGLPRRSASWPTELGLPERSMGMSGDLEVAVAGGRDDGAHRHRACSAPVPGVRAGPRAVGDTT